MLVMMVKFNPLHWAQGRRLVMPLNMTVLALRRSLRASIRRFRKLKSAVGDTHLHIEQAPKSIGLLLLREEWLGSLVSLSGILTHKVKEL